MEFTAVNAKGKDTNIYSNIISNCVFSVLVEKKDNAVVVCRLLII